MTADEVAGVVRTWVTVFKVKPASLSGHCKGIQFVHWPLGPLADGSDPSLVRLVALDAASARCYSGAWRNPRKATKRPFGGYCRGSARNVYNMLTRGETHGLSVVARGGPGALGGSA